MRDTGKSKSTVEQIRQRFDNDVERFSNLDTGQATWIDAPLILDLMTSAAAAVTPGARSVLDIGCGAGNYTLKLLQQLPNLDVTLLDLSRPMLDRALARVSAATTGAVTLIQADIRDADLGAGRFDLAITGAALHHLRDDEQWTAVFGKVYDALKPGGSFWLADFVTQAIPAVQDFMWRRWGSYLTALRDDAYRDHVYSYVEEEDTPRDVFFQMELLKSTGFRAVDLLHKSSLFAAIGAFK